MLTSEERTKKIRQRTKQLQKQQQKRRLQLLDAASVAACAALVAVLGVWMPGLTAQMQAGSVSHASGAASLLAESGALGYVLIGILSFALGMAVTVLLYRLHRRTRQTGKERNDEL